MCVCVCTGGLEYPSVKIFSHLNAFNWSFKYTYVSVVSHLAYVFSLGFYGACFKLLLTDYLICFFIWLFVTVQFYFKVG